MGRLGAPPVGPAIRPESAPLGLATRLDGSLSSGAGFGEQGVGARLVVIAGPSGAGKTSLARALVSAQPAMVLAVSHTTRAPRPGEVDGAHYHFTPAQAFRDMVRTHAFLEHAQVFDRYYGTARAPVEQALAGGSHVVLEIDWQGAAQVRRARPDCVTVMVLPPSLAALEARLAQRGDPPATIVRRMRDAAAELSHWPEFDYLVVNEDFERALGDLRSIVRALELARPAQEAYIRLHLPEACGGADGSVM